MDTKWSEKSIVISGGAGGLGRECAERFAILGSHVTILDVDTSSGEQVAHEINQNIGSHRCDYYSIDVTNESDIAEVMTSIREAHEKISVLINCAGIARGADQKDDQGQWLGMEDVSVEDWTKVLTVNLTGTFLLCKHAGRMMKQAGWGRIINTASISALVMNRGLLGLGSYSASKGGVISLTKVLAVEWAKYGITVNSISPGYMETPMGVRSQTMKGFRELQLSLIPQGRLGKPEEFAAAAIYLASEEAAHTTGSNLVLDGGYTSW